jgi:hypothetical protein
LHGSSLAQISVNGLFHIDDGIAIDIRGPILVVRHGRARQAARIVPCAMEKSNRGEGTFLAAGAISNRRWFARLFFLRGQATVKQQGIRRRGAFDTYPYARIPP